MGRGTDCDSELLGSGNPSRGLRYLRSDTADDVVYTAHAIRGLTVILIRCSYYSIFRALNFRSSDHIRNENLIYGIYTMHIYTLGALSIILQRGLITRRSSMAYVALYSTVHVCKYVLYSCVILNLQYMFMFQLPKLPEFVMGLRDYFALGDGFTGAFAVGLSNSRRCTSQLLPSLFTGSEAPTIFPSRCN